MGTLRYFFEEYAFDTDLRELHRGADVVSITPQVFDLLDYLIRNRERVVSKDDLINAVWNGRIVSDAALTTRLNAVRTAIGDSGEEQRLIKTLPRKGFRFIGPVREPQRPALTEDADELVEPSKRALALPDKPSIAILPFTNLSSDPEQDYFADGIVDDITMALSRFRLLFVIARNSSFTYKGRAVDVKQVGRELGVRYLLEGSIRKAAGKVRITTQLIDAATGAHLWVDRFEGDLSDVFALQDEITVNIVSAIQPKLLQTEIELAIRRPNNLSAYDLYLRAAPHYYSGTREGMAEALRLLSRALEIDPRYSAAASLAAFCHTLNIILRWTIDSQSEMKEAARLCRLVLSIDENDPDTLACVGWSKAYLSGDFDAAAEMLDRAVALNPNSAVAWNYRGMACQFMGQAEEALQSFERGIRLSPLDPMLYGTFAVMGFAFISLRRFDEAVAATKKSLRKNAAFTTAYRCLAAALAHLGRDAEASEAVLRILELEPDFRISEWAARTRQWRAGLLVDGLRKAGLPE
ncbi:winged helix-turn-helix domain-containing protein [Bradyrhizobium sp. TZ2]